MSQQKVKLEMLKLFYYIKKKRISNLSISTFFINVYSLSLSCLPFGIAQRQFIFNLNLTIFFFIIITKTEKWKIEVILNFKLQQNHLFYLIKWKDYSISENSWESTFNMQNAFDLIQDFHFKYLNKLALKH
jgi:hypothetical protein